MISDVVISWEKAKETINSNALEEFYRSHAQTKEYHKYKSTIAKKGYSIVQYILINRVKWVDKDGNLEVTPQGAYLFTEARDIKIIANDFPYNFEEDITHLCVWTKFPIESDPESMIGDVSKGTRALINRYVHLNFVEKLGIERDNVVWFRNFPSLQSVRELSHIHILIRKMTKWQFEKVVDTSGLVTLAVEDVKSLLSGS